MSLLWPDPRKKTIPNGQWTVTFSLDIDGEVTGDPLPLRSTNTSWIVTTNPTRLFADSPEGNRSNI